ncbi:hypothetical protein F5Y02DRAFT_423057 [Annulohypoxylon stygium]|nr:hypothetical protein F5Y02DRAFT_423057 [Annulohypoxylon stygium]
MTGRGISARIKNAYSFISHNYTFDHGETEIYLIGYSRGAFTVQCLASLIDQYGLLRRQNLRYLFILFSLWENQERKGGKWSKFLDQALKSSKNMTPWATKRGKEKEEDTEKQSEGEADNLLSIKQTLEKEGLVKAVKIKVCAVWDTVSTLGFPVGPQRFSFVGKEIPKTVENSIQALSLNESRKGFNPCVWNPKPALEGNVVKQCWFLGTHADIGGGNKDVGLAVLSMTWLIAQLRETSKNVSLNDDILMEILDTEYVIHFRKRMPKLSRFTISDEGAY